MARWPATLETVMCVDGEGEKEFAFLVVKLIMRCERTATSVLYSRYHTSI